MGKLIASQRSLSKSVAACSSTRIGGVSLPPYGSFNLGTHCGDNPDHAEENCERLFTAGNLPSKLAWFEQVHGKDMPKLISEPYASKRTDTPYSNTPGTICAVMTADCLSVLFCNRAGTETAAARVDWRGLCADVLEETVSCFADNPENILAQLGPAVGPRVFEVRAEAREAFMVVDVEASTAFIQYGDKYLANIYQPARRCPASAGVGQVFGGDRCTYTENKTFFSYCRDKTTGHTASLIWPI